MLALACPYSDNMGVRGARNSSLSNCYGHIKCNRWGNTRGREIGPAGGLLRPINPR